MADYTKMAPNEVVAKVMEALKANNIDAVVATSGEDAKRKVLEMIPAGAEVMTMTSVTLDTLGISKEINESGKYNSVRMNVLMSKDAAITDRMKKKEGAGPAYTVGSVHAVTEDGKVLIASNTGSQLPAYAYGADHVIWVVGTQKITKNTDEALKRIYEYVLPLESERAHKAYGVPGSAVRKILIMNSEGTPGRITIVFVPEQLGF